jgi:hypothetical protein
MTLSEYSSRAELWWSSTLVNMCRRRCRASGPAEIAGQIAEKQLAGAPLKWWGSIP